MKRTRQEFSRRAFLSLAGAVGISVQLGHGRALAAPGPLLTKAIPNSGERLPVIGMGSWLTFDVRDDRVARERRREVLQAFFDGGGAMIDSSPMYGSSEEVIGYFLARVTTLSEALRVSCSHRWGLLSASLLQR